MPKDFDLPAPQWPDEQKVIEALVNDISDARAEPGAVYPINHTVPPNVVKAVADIATNAWMARIKMIEGPSGTVRDEMKRVHRHIEVILDTLREIGVSVQDHTGDVFDYGMALKVLTSQPTSGITRESVLETIKPTVYWQEQRIQMGEVVIATPTSTDSKV